MLKSKKPWLAVGLLLYAIVCEAQQKLNLSGILHRIEETHPDLKMMDAKVKELDAYAEGARNWEAPKFGAGFFMTPYNYMMWSRAGALYHEGMNQGMGSFMIQGEQMIPNRKMLDAEERYMKSMSGMEVAQKGVMRNMLFAEAKMAYYRWLVLEKKKNVLKESQNLLKYMIESAEVRYKYNQEKLSSIYKAKAALLDLDRMNLMFDGDIRQQKVMLNTLMLQDRATDFQIDTLSLTYLYPNTPLNLDTNAVINRSDLRVIDQNLTISRYKQEVEFQKLKPMFGVQYGHMFAFGNQWQFTLMGMVTIPFAKWSSRQIKANIKGLDYQRQAYNKQRDGLTNQILGNLADRQVMMQSYQAQIKQYENEQFPALRKRYQSTLLAYEQNTDELFMVLDAWMELKMARMNQLDLLQQLLQAQVEYEKELEKR